jgi:hypothetical protein
MDYTLITQDPSTIQVDKHIWVINTRTHNGINNELSMTKEELEEKHSTCRYCLAIELHGYFTTLPPEVMEISATLLHVAGARSVQHRTMRRTQSSESVQLSTQQTLSKHSLEKLPNKYPTSNWS